MKNILFLITILTLFSCTERDNQEFVKTGLDFAEEIKKIPPNFSISLPLIAEKIPDELKSKGILWFPEIEDDVEISCTSIGPCIDFEWKLDSFEIFRGEKIKRDSIDFNSLDFISRGDLPEQYYYELVLRAKSSDGIFREVTKKFVLGYPDPLTMFIPSLEDDGATFGDILRSDDEYFRKIPNNIKYVCEEKNNIFCALIKDLSISTQVENLEANNLATTGIAEFMGNDGVTESVNQGEEGSPTEFGTLTLRKEITYMNGVSRNKNIEFNFTSNTYLASKWKGIILFENKDISPHFLKDVNDNGKIDEDDQISLLFNLKIKPDADTNSDLRIKRNDEFIEQTSEVLGTNFSFEVDEVDQRRINITLGDKPNLLPGDKIVFTESDTFHAEGRSPTLGHQCIGEIKEKPVPLKEESGITI